MNADEHEKPFGEVVKETRTRLGLTQEKLGKILGITHAQVSKIENGEAASSTLKKLFECRFGIAMEDPNTEAEDKPFGEIMRETRKRLGLTQDEVATRLGVKRSTIAGIECGTYNAGGSLKVLFYDKFSPSEEQPVPQKPKGFSSSIGRQILLEEIKAAREDLGQPMLDIEIEAWERSTDGELLRESALLRETLELRSTRELLAGAQTFRKKRESARNGGGRSC